jgi:hypothetical protein
VLVVPEPLARSAGGLTLTLTGKASWAGEAAYARRFTGLDIRARVVSPRRRVDGNLAIAAAAAEASR